MNANNSDSVIRITKEEATSSHVDDLLKRQMSLRGDPGVTRDRGRRWYYQGWLILGIVGTLGALLAWAIIEPFFDDLLYLQGPITALDLSSDLPRQLTEDQEKLDRRFPIGGTVTLSGEQIFMLHSAKLISADGTRQRLALDGLKVGDSIGVYVEYLSGSDRSLALGKFVVRSPGPQSPSRAKMTLDHLHARKQAAGLLFFAIVAGLIGLCIGTADGTICRLPRRALLSGVIGLLVGFVGGLISGIAANLVYGPLNALAMKMSSDSFSSLSTFGFVVQMIGRSLAWGLAGMA